MRFDGKVAVVSGGASGIGRASAALLAERGARVALLDVNAELGEAAVASIVTVSSVQGLASQRNVCAYTASKHGLIGLTRSMAMDLASAGIRANVVCPGTVQTPMLDWAASLDPDPASVLDACRAMHPVGRIAQPTEIAEAVVFLAHERASFITGSVLTVDGGLLTLIGGTPRTDR